MSSVVKRSPKTRTVYTDVSRIVRMLLDYGVCNAIQLCCAKQGTTKQTTKQPSDEAAAL